MPNDMSGEFIPKPAPVPDDPDAAFRAGQEFGRQLNSQMQGIAAMNEAMRQAAYRESINCTPGRVAVMEREEHGRVVRYLAYF